MSTTPVYLEISWSDLFSGKSANENRDRWDVWKALAIADGGETIVEKWTRHECHGCSHQNDDWCCFIGRPCTYNPLFTPGTGLVGMACGGMGFAPKAYNADLFI